MDSKKQLTSIGLNVYFDLKPSAAFLMLLVFVLATIAFFLSKRFLQ